MTESQTPDINRFDATRLLALPTCSDATSQELMASRWLWTAADGSTPAHLLAPRFVRVRPLRVPVPPEIVASGEPCEVWIEGVAQPGWFTHLRVSYDGAPFPVTLAHPLLSGRPSDEVQLRESDIARHWSTYACTLPPGTAHLEISKLPNMEAGLAAIEFRPGAAPSTLPRNSEEKRGPSIAGIFDHSICIDETLQAESNAEVFEFYDQTRAAGFTDLFVQVYEGGASWSEIARVLRETPLGHREYANWREPSSTLIENLEGFQRHFEAIRERGLRAVASFRINNEWIVEWAKEWYTFTDGAPDIASVFSYEHPEFWMSYKDGARHGGGLDFGFPEVREYRLAIIREWCDKFQHFDEICLDLYRHPPMVSYPEHLVQAFLQKTGINVRTVEPIEEDTVLPEWLEFRAEYFTQFMREVRCELQTRYGDRVLLSARVANSTERALQDGADLRVWLREGLIDRYLLQHRPPRNPLEQDSRSFIQAAHRAGARVLHFFEGPQSLTLGENGPENFRPLLENWSSWNSDGFGFYEAERIVRDGRWLRELPKMAADF
jgi:hypothetical protein